MARAKYTGPEDRLSLYEAVVDRIDGLDRKGAANPYTSVNGYMTSFIDKEGSVGLRLDPTARAEFLELYGSRIAVQYGKEMKEFAVVPDELLERTGELSGWFQRGFDWVRTLKPK